MLVTIFKGYQLSLCFMLGPIIDKWNWKLSNHLLSSSGEHILVEAHVRILGIEEKLLFWKRRLELKGTLYLLHAFFC